MPDASVSEIDRRQRAERDGSRGHQPDDRTKDNKPGLFQNPYVRIGAIVAVAILLIAALLYWLYARQYESTDDAFIDTHIVHIAPQVPGQVMRVYVNDNQLVHRGDPLVDIDPADYRARLDQAEAQENQARTQLAQAEANETGAAAQAANAAQDLARYRTLARINPAAVAQQQMDQATAAERNAIAQRDAARAQIANAEAQIKVAQAALAAARLNLGYAHLTAPADGHVAQRTVAVGDYVTAGQELMAVVPLHIWVTANFKETQLELMRIGQSVTLGVDACGGADIRGHVDSIQRGAGQAFGILPPENATGNYVKVVQRVPVKILLDRVPQGCVLGPGMSVEPSVKVR